MTCREIRVHTKAARLPTGGASHGSTCCICGRPLEELHLDVYADAGQDCPDHNPRMQVCSETCVGPAANYLHAYRESEAAIYWRMPLCPAHGCVRVIPVAALEELTQ